MKALCFALVAGVALCLGGCDVLGPTFGLKPPKSNARSMPTDAHNGGDDADAGEMPPPVEMLPDAGPLEDASAPDASAPDASEPDAMVDAALPDPDAAPVEPDAVCGDGRLADSEHCDDGNLTGDDGCSSSCSVEPDFICDTPGSPCHLRPPGDLCRTAIALADDFRGNFDFQGLSPDDDHCPDCGVVRWFKLVQPVSGITAVYVNSDYRAPVVVFDDGCPEHYVAPELAAWRNDAFFDAFRNYTGQPRNIWIMVRSDAGGGDFELRVRNGMAGCGDGWLRANRGESCDDANNIDGDGCSATCSREPGWRCPSAGGPCVVAGCGDHVVETGVEACDDGNKRDGDGCSAQCAIEPNSVCYSGNEYCRRIVCGDGHYDAGEQCDDGNLDPDDGCSATCRLEDGASRNTAKPLTLGVPDYRIFSQSCSGCNGVVWYTHVLAPRETLDVQVDADFSGRVEFVTDVHDACAPPPGIHPWQPFWPGTESVASARNDSAGPLQVWVAVSAEAEYDGSYEGAGGFVLRASVAAPAEPCGDGALQGSEQCDDANVTDGDGCSAACVREPGYACSGAPSTCVAAAVGDLCEQPSPIHEGVLDFGFSGYTAEPYCGVGVSCTHASRFWRATVPEGFLLWVSVPSSDAVDGELTLHDAQGAFIGTGGEKLGSLRFGAPTQQLRAAHGLVVLGIHASSVLIEVSDLGASTSDAHFSLQTAILPVTGCGDRFLDETSTSAGYVWGIDERCDDGNTDDGDGCSAACEVEAGWDCSAGFCLQANCGDGVTLGLEACDDGNTESGDGCSASCEVEAGYLCGPLDQPYCRRQQPGESCDDPLPLIEADYDFTGAGTWNGAPSWATADLFFEVPIPAGRALALEVQSDAMLQITSTWRDQGCPAEAPAHVSFAQYLPQVIASTGPTTRTALIRVTSTRAGQLFRLHPVLRSVGCGDYHHDLELEGCDDGNRFDGDGCSSECELETGAMCSSLDADRCTIPLTGDLPEIAQTLTDGTYSLSNYVLQDHCGAGEAQLDRWFDIDVPAGKLLIVRTTSMLQGAIELYWDTLGWWCSRADTAQVGPERPALLSLRNESSHSPMRVQLRLLDRGYPLGRAVFHITHEFVTPGCGDGYWDAWGQYGPREACDDGNRQGGDGCSPTCALEP